MEKEIDVRVEIGQEKAERIATRLGTYYWYPTEKREPPHVGPFELNEYQRAMLDAQEVARSFGYMGVIVLTHRRAGLTTMELARMDYESRHGDSVAAVAHCRESENYMRRIVSDLSLNIRSGHTSDEWPPERRGFRILRAGAEYGRMASVSRLLLDNAAWYKKPDDEWTRLHNCVRADGFITVASAWHPKAPGADWFAETWLRSVEGETGLLPFFRPWWMDTGNVGASSLHRTDVELRSRFKHGPQVEHLSWMDKRTGHVPYPDAVAGEFPCDDNAVILHAQVRRGNRQKPLLRGEVYNAV